MKIFNESPVSRPVRLLTALTAVVLVVVIALVMLLHALPSSVLELDMTANDLYKVSGYTTRMLQDLEDPIEIRVFADRASVDQRFVKYMEKYAALSPLLTLDFIDPQKDPAAAKEYDGESNTVQVRNASDGSTATFRVSGYEGQDAAAVLYDYASYYTHGTQAPVSFDAEGRLAGAIGTVTGSQRYTICYMSGHGESPMAASITTMLEKANFDQYSVELLSAGSIPEACDLLVCNTPTTDLAEDELTMLKRWLADGGKMFLVLDENTLPNFSALLKVYGIQTEQGYLADSANVYQQYADRFGMYCFHPVYNEDSPLCEGVVSDGMVIGAVPLSLVTPERRASETEYFMSSSTSGVNYYGQADEEIEEGIYYVGVVATEAVDGGAESRLTVISSGYYVSDTVLNNFPSLSNSTVIMNAVNANFDGKTTVAIGAKSLGLTFNSLPRTTPYALFFILIIPVVFLAAGLIFWMRRRKQ